MADALDLGSSAARRGGSNPLARTIRKIKAPEVREPFKMILLNTAFGRQKFEKVSFDDGRLLVNGDAGAGDGGDRGGAR